MYEPYNDNLTIEKPLIPAQDTRDIIALDRIRGMVTVMVGCMLNNFTPRGKRTTRAVWS